MENGNRANLKLRATKMIKIQSSVNVKESHARFSSGFYTQIEISLRHFLHPHRAARAARWQPSEWKPAEEEVENAAL